MRVKRGRISEVLLAVFLFVACSRGGDGHRLVLDGRPRLPDAEGVVESISFTRITLDGGRSYAVSKKLQSFSTYDLGAVPMLQRQGQYVQIGLDGRTVTWMAGIGVVVRAPGQAPVVFYNGHLLRVDDFGGHPEAPGGRRAVFRDGTVLRLADSVTSPVSEGLVRAEIDPDRHEVRALVLP
jgi:hypothetical protein